MRLRNLSGKSTKNFLSLGFVLFIFCCIAHGQPSALPADAKPPRLKISREHPLIIWQGSNTDGVEVNVKNIINDWNHLPEDLRPYCIFQIECRYLDQEHRYERFVAILEQLQAAGVPTCLQVFDPHPEYAFPLKYVEKLIERFDSIVAVQATEMRTSFYSKVTDAHEIYTPLRIRYMIELTKMAARHGIHTSMQHQQLRWLHVATDGLSQELRDTLQTYRAYVLPQNEHLGPQHLPRQTSTWGLWMADFVDNWGVEPQSWWWQNANFVEPGVFGVCPENWVPVFPKGIYRPMILQAAMLGATVYGFEPNWDLFEHARPDVWYEDILPTMREVIHRGLIADRDELYQKAKLAYQVPRSKSLADFHQILRDVDFMAEEGYLARAAYGVYARGLQHELIPNRNRAFFIPILPYGTSEPIHKKFERVIEPGACGSVEEYEKLLEGLYPEPDREAAYVQHVGRFTYVMQTQENLYEKQDFSIETPKAVKALQAAWDGDRVSLSWEPVPGAQSYEICLWNYGEKKADEFPIGSDWAHWEILQKVSKPEGIVTVKAGNVLGVRVKTSVMEKYEGSVNFLDCLVFDSEWSRIAEIVEVPAQGETSRSRLRAFADTRPEHQEWFDLGAGLPSKDRAVADEVKDSLRNFISAFEAEDIRALAGFYAQDYTDPNGYDRDYALRAWLWWFQRMERPYCAATIHAWDTSRLASEGVVRMKLGGFWRGVMMWDEPWGADGFARIPRNSEVESWWSWKKNRINGTWEIVTTEPACPNFGEMLWNSRDHTYPSSMDDFRDGPKPWAQ